MIDRVALLADLRKQVVAAEKDLTEQVEHPVTEHARAARDRLLDEYREAKEVGRTAATWSTWLVGDDKFPGRIPQVAAAWVLGTVFVRFCEDNGLITEPYLTGPDTDRRDLAQARYDAYVESDPDPTYRGWLLRAFAELDSIRAGKLLFSPAHNALFQIPLSHEGAGALVKFWRARDKYGQLEHDFTDPLRERRKEGWNTHFLGDLYQDLSENARKAYALLQTPVFVEEFILDRTMTPALSEFGHEEFKIIDPTCGSGHFVLGAFRRLVEAWEVQPRGKDLHQRVRSALDSVHGVDLNPFAVAIARFRLLVAAMAAARIDTLAKAAEFEWPIHLAVGDSLIQKRQLEGDLSITGGAGPLAEFSYGTEDVPEHPRILENGRYHVVVGNPPYITAKDKKLNKAYKEIYKGIAVNQYHLSTPFAVRFFELAIRGDSDGRGYGRVGQITDNAFMKREFGKNVIEDYLAEKVELTEVIDTSGAYIPGHGTPTVILIGTTRSGDHRAPTVRTVRSIQGEPKAPADPKDGLVWNEIITNIDSPGFAGRWVSVDDLDRIRYFSKHPWILLDGGLEMVKQIEQSSAAQLSAVRRAIGRYTHTGNDEAYFANPGTWTRFGIDRSHIVPLAEGDVLRDWNIYPDTESIFPYNSDHQADHTPDVVRLLWRSRTLLRTRREPGGVHEEIGLTWFEWSRWHPERFAVKLGIAFAFVATHNHFILDRGGKVFKQSAPVIKLPKGADEEEHLRLLGLLNSSTACFWLKMVSQSKGNGGIGGGISDELWEHRFEFTGTKLESFPLPKQLPVRASQDLDRLAHRISQNSPAEITKHSTPTAALLRDARADWHSDRARMIAKQEELDWQTYSLYKVYPDNLCASEHDLPELSLGERAFEIVLARRIAQGEASGEWFHRHNSTPITEIPSDWPASYRRIVEKRIDAIENNRAINMIERPEYKRRWATDGWDTLQHRALRSWLLERIERHDHWHDENDQPVIRTLPRLTDLISQDEDFTSVAAIYAPRQDLAKVVTDLFTNEHVPFLAALRYKPSGLRKRADWEHVWDLQRQEDNAPNLEQQLKIRASIPTPPKYTSADFLRTSYWQARGKLDVPKERFISYGDTNTPTPQRYGWAGWDHREQAQALATYFTTHALDTEQITPLLAGLLELQPWLYQWHNEFDDAYSGSPAEFFAGYRRQVQSEHGLTDDDLRAWRPPATRGRAANSGKTTRARRTKE
ncbi:BREX-2 system adenine-specific DNA-methyltransferase PglX [Nocardia blacklockiae]|uniref:BREX-2 system adenine-specific DNA-methyltransferase PglX n=1 Tax=Nocardia blacklockiae TaxID=480036 RepID=UPI00189360D5|nr:BREX-2 system adenine-specific DNA-methyltransferase PglX [Nocardia blacklockiae]MBF6175294.1 BREX-2 system adenine-specific DNA-methyltransferase PglX [Nocardia blacklockiae]